jgi:H/ACA ribonucleoprotein complex subunit 2
MANDRSEKKDKKEKRKSVDASGVKKEKKEKRKSDATAVLNAIEDAAPGAVAVDADGDVIVDASVVADESSDAIPIGALVPFANPLCDDKATKKVLKTVKKGKFFSRLSFHSMRITPH